MKETKKYYGLYIIIDDEDENFKPLIPLHNPNDRYNILPYYDISNYGTVINRNTGRVMTHFIDKLGYHRVSIQCVDRSYNKIITRTYLVHRLVGMVFVEGYDPSSKRVIINHLDSNPSHNYYKNLEWCTQSENILHAISVGNMDLVNQALKNSRNNRIYTNDLVEFIAQLLEQQKSPSEIQNILGISDKKIKSVYGIIDRIRYEDCYKYLRDKYNIPTKIIKRTDIDEVHEICSLLEQGYLARDIIKLYGITDKKEKERMATKISKIRLGKHYTDISKEYNIPKMDAVNNKKYSDEDVHRMCKLISDGYTNLEIIKIMNIDNNDKRAYKYLNSLKGRFIRTNISSEYDW